MFEDIEKNQIIKILLCILDTSCLDERVYRIIAMENKFYIIKNM